jgi:hypothetical protein
LFPSLAILHRNGYADSGRRRLKEIERCAYGSALVSPVLGVKRCALLSAREMKDTIEIKWPWEMIWMEYADELIAQIKAALPPAHEMRKHDIFPGIKWNRRPIFIVDDDTTGQRLLVNFESMKRWRKTKFKVPTIKVFKDDAEIAAMIERDHVTECAKYNGEFTSR